MADLSRKQDGKFLSAHAISAAPAGDARKFACHHAQHLVAGFVAVGVVELFEVIDVHDGNRVRFFKVEQGVVESAPRRQRSQFVVVSQKVRILDDGTDQDQTCGRHVGALPPVLPPRPERKETSPPAPTAGRSPWVGDRAGSAPARSRRRRRRPARPGSGWASRKGVRETGDAKTRGRWFLRGGR